MMTHCSTSLRLCAGFALLLLGACSESTTNTTSQQQSDNAFFTDSNALTERYGTRTTRELSPQIDEATASAVVRSINNFSFDLHRATSISDPSAGSIESGYSAAVALALTSAATGGDTYSSLAALLGIDALIEDDVHTALNELALKLESRANEDLVLRTANRVFVKPGLDLQTEFLDTATVDYGAPVTEADFAGAPAEVAEEVNGWVSDQTDGFIPSIVDEFDPGTVFALLNAIFLDANWQETFQTRGNQPFTNLDGTTVDAPSFGGRTFLPISRQENLTAVEIPYAGGELAMLIMMPDDMEAFEASLNNNTLDELLTALEVTGAELTVPNWELDSSLDLVQLLSPLGLPANPWDLARLVDSGTSLDVIALQQARIEVDENGTRAAAVTLVAGVTSVPEPLEALNINQPFVYVLRDRTTGVVLFSGRVVEL